MFLFLLIFVSNKSVGSSPVIDFDELVEHIALRDDMREFVDIWLDETPDIIFRKIEGLADQLWIPIRLHRALKIDSIEIFEDMNHIEHVVTQVHPMYPELSRQDVQTMAYRWWTYCMVPFLRNQAPEEKLWIPFRRLRRRGLKMKPYAAEKFLTDEEYHKS